MSCSSTPYPVSYTQFRLGDSELTDQIRISFAPAHPTGGGGTFCVGFGMYISTRVKILGAGDQGFSLISFTGLPANVSPHPRAGSRVLGFQMIVLLAAPSEHFGRHR